MWYEPWRAPSYATEEAIVLFLWTFPFDTWDTSLHNLRIKWGAKYLSKCACLAPRISIMSEFGSYLWKSLHFWQMDAIIKAWTSALLNPRKVKSVCSGMWWLALSNRGMRSRWCVCYRSERGHSSSHMWVFYVLALSKSLIISYSKVAAHAKKASGWEGIWQSLL